MKRRLGASSFFDHNAHSTVGTRLLTHKHLRPLIEELIAMCLSPILSIYVVETEK